MEEWWKEADTSKMKSVTVKEFSQMLVRKGIISKSFEVIGMVKQTIGDRIDLNGTITR